MKSIEEVSEELLRQMEITEKLTSSLKRGKKTWIEVDNERIKKIQDERKRSSRNRKWRMTPKHQKVNLRKRW